ncbi:MAG TPA: transketolase [Thermodesulfobacteriota bacterium]|nr:transketolase [Thermodesulfobacteriota bacterium]
MLDAAQIEELKSLAKTIRVDILTMLNKASSGHTGGSLSAVEILVSLYFYKMRHNPKDPKWPDRDRFVLSKGHGAPALYAVLARSGYFDYAELMGLRKLGSILQGHPDMKVTPGIDVSTGSLGQGLSMANGMALALKLDKRPARVYALMGDGENQEGQIWEAAMAAAHYKLDNVCGILDHNGLQIDGPVNEIMKIEPIADKWACFGWEVFRVNGHDFQEIISALDKAETVKNKPSLIVARTVKGKGVSFFEGKVEYHGVPPTDEELAKALAELGINS